MPLPQHLVIDNSLLDQQWKQGKQSQLAKLPMSQLISTDLDFIKELLPSTYTLELTNQNGIRCRSKTGISDATDEWVPIFQAIKKHFGSRFLEVNHTTCSNHIDFTIYFRK